MGSVTFKNLNWAFILACYKRSGLSKNKFHEQILPLLYPNIDSLPAISTFNSYLKQQEQAALALKSSKKRKATPKRDRSFSRTFQLDSWCLRLISLSPLEYRSSAIESQVLWLRLIASVLNVPPWYAGLNCEQQRLDRSTKCH